MTDLPRPLSQFVQTASSVVLAARRHVHGIDPEIWRRLGAQFANWHQWADRGIVLAAAAVTGAAVVVFSLLAEWAIQAFRLVGHWGTHGNLATLIWTPTITVALVWWTRRFVPGAAGSGIPQVVRALEGDLEKHQQSWLISLRLSLHKVLLVSGGLLAGLSIGREGPTVQVGAGIMAAAKKWLSPSSGIDAHDLMVAGAAAGIAAAFNTPLGGIVFALEQLTRRRHISHTALVIAAIVVSGLVSVSVFGNETYFGKLRVQGISYDIIGPGLLIALVAGLTGGLFSRLIVVSVRGLPDRFSEWRQQAPLRFAGACGLAVAVIGLVTGGATAGAGYLTTRSLLEGSSELPGIYTLLKFCATWISAWSGVPAGVFAPSLAIGAGIGHDIASWLHVAPDESIPLIAMGMVSFLAATTGGPITAFIIVMEMVAGHAMVLTLMASALIASGVARLVARPMYQELALLLPIPAPAPDVGKRP